MTHSTIRNLLHLSLLTTTLLLQLTHGQVGTITQDVYTLSAFPLQKPCAQSCFVATGFCPNDVLGGEIGCKSHSNCADSNWQATNDCYCRTDLQKPAQDYLTSCIENKCSVGDVRIDASSAGSIYAQYCAEKGYSPAALPATVQATTTGPGASTRTVGGGVGSGPTASSTSDSPGSSSESSRLSTSTIIGIVVGSLAGLAFLAVTLKIVFKWFGFGRGRKAQYPQQPPPIYQQPVYPMKLYPETYYQQKAESEVTPDDSVSMISEMPRPAPTLVSNVQSYLPHRY
ncbi:hypothetical protein EPUS_01193 [Endocarpon pusillum Z07020]|uniref:Extracellular membrane protein CFEM domain-containing protein n=1 Tax=Endocarpon pusillum (strain Z07020 / HMAS-L-300199) TaxID=1263415 RepID=U1GC26_ENDPU|nr:uncharacterized protein EPUS_01193 [Endocarpon pusillum Z07020]ERF69236.1 hypothetical protein EPUS_01193 [Endocarpon pusillum Z07020]